MQKIALALAALMSGCIGGCAGRVASLAQLDGSEPQRLSFGDPKTVQNQLAEKMNYCWFGGPTPVLKGYRLETVSLMQVSDTASEPQASNIRIFASDGQPQQAFEVQFHPFNSNTLISTRNNSLPADLAARLKRDVETWVIGDKGCGAPKPVTAEPARTAAPRLQTASWAPAQVASASDGAPAH